VTERNRLVLDGIGVHRTFRQHVGGDGARLAFVDIDRIVVVERRGEPRGRLRGQSSGLVTALRLSGDQRVRDRQELLARQERLAVDGEVEPRACRGKQRRLQLRAVRSPQNDGEDAALHFHLREGMGAPERNAPLRPVEELHRDAHRAGVGAFVVGEKADVGEGRGNGSRRSRGEQSDAERRGNVQCPEHQGAPPVVMEWSRHVLPPAGADGA
jgi:hypothetical protein